MSHKIVKLLGAFAFLFHSSLQSMKEESKKELLYQGEGFHVKVTKNGILHCLSKDDETNIINWINTKSISEPDKIQLTSKIQQFLAGTPIAHYQKPHDAADYTCLKYRFRRFDLNREGMTFNVCECHCRAIASWLQYHKIQQSHEKDRIKVLNYGNFFVLYAKKIDAYKRLATTKDRKWLLKKYRMIAIARITDGVCTDITNQGISESKITFCFNNNEKSKK